MNRRRLCSCATHRPARPCPPLLRHPSALHEDAAVVACVAMLMEQESPTQEQLQAFLASITAPPLEGDTLQDAKARTMRNINAEICQCRAKTLAASGRR